MSRKHFNKIPAVLLGFGLVTSLLVPAGPAMAVVPVTVDADPGALANTLSTIANGIEDAATMAEAVLNSQIAQIEALLNHSGQQTVNSNAQTTAMSNIADVQDMRQTQRAIQQTQVRSFQNATTGPSACNVITGNLGGQTLDTEAHPVVIGMTRAIQTWENGDPVGGSATAATLGRGAAGKKMSVLHCTYANPGDVAYGSCTTLAADAMQNQDLRATTFLESANSTMSSDDYTAAQLFLTQAAPRSMGGLPPGTGKTESGIALVAQRNASMARASISSSTLAAIVQAHNPSAMSNQQVNGSTSTGTTTGNATSTTGVSLSAWAEATAAQTLGYGTSNNFPNGVSKDAWLELRAKGWFLNPEWVAAVNADPVQATKESTMILSFIAYQGWESYKLQEREAATLAGILNILEDEKRSKM